MKEEIVKLNRRDDTGEYIKALAGSLVSFLFRLFLFCGLQPGEPLVHLNNRKRNTNHVNGVFR